MIFISHSWQDKDVACIWAVALRQAGLPVWIDAEEIRAGDSIARAMSDGLRNSDRLLIAWSSAAEASPHVWNEIDAFYIRYPAPGKMLFVRLDETKVPPLYASRIYLSGGLGDLTMEIVRWATSGHTDSGVTVPPSAMPAAHVLHQFPRGPHVRSDRISDAIIDAYAALARDRVTSRRILDRAAQLRRGTDPNDSTVTFIDHGDLPQIEVVGARSYWDQAFGEAGLHGPRGLAALLFAQSDEQFPEEARRARAELISYLRSKKSQEVS